jgi:D-sedoheptulose 7-phosphate isomerase
MKHDRINEILSESAETTAGLSKNAAKIEKAARITAAALKKGATVFIAGNGGSAADSQHMAAELVGRFRKERRPLAACALTADTSALTAIANDYGFEEVFARQLRALAKKGDIFFAISTSGNSEDVLRAVAEARKMGLSVIGLTGRGGRLAKVVDICLSVDSKNTARIQEAHITVIHALCELIEDDFA